MQKQKNIINQKKHAQTQTEQSTNKQYSNKWAHTQLKPPNKNQTRTNVIKIPDKCAQSGIKHANDFLGNALVTVMKRSKHTSASEHLATSGNLHPQGEILFNQTIKMRISYHFIHVIG